MKNFPDIFKTEHFRFVNYALLTENESRAVWEARNHPDIRKWMVNDIPISWGNHQLFINGLNKSSDRVYYAVWHDLGGAILN